MAYTVEIKNLYQEAGNSLDEARQIYDGAKGAPLSAEDNARWERLMGDFDTKSAQAKNFERMDSADRERTTINEAKRLPNLDNAAHAGSAGTKSDERSLEVKAFDTYLRRGEVGLAQEQKAALNIGTDNQGGYMTPTEYSDQLVTELYDISVFRQAGATIIPLNTDNTSVPKQTAGPKAERTAEAGTYNGQEPTFGQVVFIPTKYTRLSKASQEMVADSRFPLWDRVLKPDFAQAFATAENDDFTSGTGSGQPEGVLLNVPLGLTLPNGSGQIATITSPDSIIALYHKLDYKYRANAKWMMNDAMIAIVRQFKGSDGQYIWQASLAAGTPDLLLGKPIISNPSMPVPAANAKSILFGDFRYYWIGDREGMEIMVLKELYAGNGQVGFRAFKRVDGHVVLTAAFTALKQAATA